MLQDLWHTDLIILVEDKKLEEPVFNFTNINLRTQKELHELLGELIN